MAEPLTRVTSLPQAEQDRLIQLAQDQEIYLLVRLEGHTATAHAGVFADEQQKYDGQRRTPTTGYFHIQWQLAEKALECGISVIHQWHAVDPEIGEGETFSGYYYVMDETQTITAKDVWCKQSHLDSIHENARSGSDNSGKLDARTVTNNAGKLQHKIKNKTHTLDGAMNAATNVALDKSEYQSVWAAYVKIAQDNNPPAPLLGYVEGEGVKYTSDTATDGIAFDNKKAFAARFKRRSPSR